MDNSSLANSLSVSVRAYRALLVVYPRKFRQNYEIQMVQVFRDAFRDAHHRHGLPGVVDLWLHTFVDLIVTALNERLMERSQFMFSPKVIIWGGVASLFCGLAWMITGFSDEGSPMVLALALLLGLGGLIGLYFRQAGLGGSLGFGGLALAILGTVLAFASFLAWSSTTSPAVSAAKDPLLFARPFLIFSLGLAALGGGIILLGATRLPERAMRRWRAVPLGLGLLNILAGIMIWAVLYLPQSQGLNPWRQWYLVAGKAVYTGDFVGRLLGVFLGLGWLGLGMLLAADANPQGAQTPAASAEAR